MKSHAYFMRLALRESLKAKTNTRPNPRVGAILVRKNKVLATGFHHQAGQIHAEIDCLNKVKKILPADVLYVTLEPCFHFGKTPPCAPELVKRGLKNIVIACADECSATKQKSISWLKKQGVHVVVGVEKKSALWVHREFFVNQTQKRPYVVLKMAQTLNGKVAPLNQKVGNRLKISSLQAQKLTFHLRASVNAVMLGHKSFSLDLPKLTVRNTETSVQPLKIILDPRAQINPGLFTPQTLWCVTKKGKLKMQGVRVVTAPLRDFGKLVLKKIYAVHKVYSILLEGGPTTAQKFLKAGLVDEVYLYVAPKIFKKGLKRPIIKGFTPVTVQKLGPDLIIRAIKNDNLDFIGPNGLEWDECLPA